MTSTAILEPILPTVLSTRLLPHAHERLVAEYGGDPERHRALALITCDQDDSLYVALDEATKHAPVDIIYARSFYAGAAHASGKLSGEVLGVLAASDPDEVREGLDATLRCLAHDACFYAADDKGEVALFPHVISSLGHYLSAQAGLSVGDAMAYLVAPPLEGTFGFDAALKASDVRLAKTFAPPTETNYAAAWLSGSLEDCRAAAEAFAETVVNVANQPLL